MNNDRPDGKQRGNSFQTFGDINRRDVVLNSSALLAATALAGVALPDLANAQVQKPGVDPDPGFNNKIPEKILTPDKVETRIGTLNFVDGVPTAETAQKIYDLSTSCVASKSSSTSCRRLRSKPSGSACAELGATKSNQALIFDQLCDSNPLLLTANTDTVYCFAVPRPADRRADRDRGAAGQRARHGRRRVLPLRHRHGRPRAGSRPGRQVPHLPPDYKGAVPKDKKDGGQYFVARSPSYVNLRGAARLPQGRQARRVVEAVPRGPQDLFAQQGRQPAEDGVHQRVEGAVQHRPRQ